MPGKNWVTEHFRWFLHTNKAKSLFCLYLAFHSQKLPKEVVNNVPIVLTSQRNRLSGRQPGLASTAEIIPTFNLCSALLWTFLPLWSAPLLEIQSNLLDPLEASETLHKCDHSIWGIATLSGGCNFPGCHPQPSSPEFYRWRKRDRIGIGIVLEQRSDFQWN